MVTITKRLTAADLILFELNADDFEILDGELKERKTGGGLHGRIGFGIGHHLGLHVFPHNLGRLYTSDTGFVIVEDPLTVLRPDVAFVREDRLRPGMEDRGFMPLVPDLVVEVVSPGDRTIEIGAKDDQYRRAGVPLLWLVDPRARTITVYQPDRPPLVLDEDDELDGGDVLPGFRLAVRDIFP